MTDAEICLELIERVASGSKTKFANTTGIPLPVVSRICNGKTKLRTKYDVIIKTYPQVNLDWLKTGEGDPGTATPKDYLPLLAQKDETISVLTREIKIQQEIIELLKSHILK